MGKNKRKYGIDRMVIVVLFAVFAGCMVTVLAFGALSYRNLVLRDGRAYTNRTGVQYVAAKVRHNDVAGMVWTGSFFEEEDKGAAGIPTLYLGMYAEEELYVTKLYYYDGYIRELLCEVGEDTEPEDGQEVLPASSFFVKKEGSLLTVTVGDEDGKEQSISLALRSNGEVEP